MIEMIKAEWKKNNIKKYMRNAAVMSGAIVVLLLTTIGQMEAGSKIDLNKEHVPYVSIEVFTNMSYVIFTSVMMASFIISEYNNKTIYIMFSYPIKRQKILLAQMLSVWIFNVIALIITKLLAYGIFSFANRFIDVHLSGINFSQFSFYFQIIIISIMMISICFIALLVGVKMKSSKAAIVGSVILVCLTQGNIGAYALADNLVFHIILFILSIISVFLTIYNIDKVDI